MPRGPRLAAPGVRHQVMVRGIERRAIFRDERARAEFVDRVAALAEAKGWTVAAWPRLPNHAHLLVRSGRRPLAAARRSLLTGYAGAFNRRHTWHGHLVQNRDRGRSSVDCIRPPRTPRPARSRDPGASHAP
jgi:REP element-mobilizing transposase RayT